MIFKRLTKHYCLVYSGIISGYERPCQREDTMQIWNGVDMIGVGLSDKNELDLTTLEQSNQLTVRNCSDRCLDTKLCNTFSYDPDVTTGNNCWIVKKMGMKYLNESPKSPNLISGTRCSLERKKTPSRPADEEYSKGNICSKLNRLMK